MIRTTRTWAPPNLPVQITHILFDRAHSHFSFQKNEDYLLELNLGLISFDTFAEAAATL